MCSAVPRKRIHVSKNRGEFHSDIYLKRIEIQSSNGSCVFVRLSHYCLCSGVHYDLWVIYSYCAIFTATNQSPSCTIGSHSKIHPYDTVQPMEYTKLFAKYYMIVTHHS